MSLSVDIEKRLPGFHLRVQLEAGAGPTALLGASGCGKSMTLRCIAGVEKPDRGRICLGDRVLFDSEAGIDLPPQQRRVGLLFQSYALFPHMTLAQNVACGLRQDPSLSKGEKAARCAAMIRKLGLSGLEKRLPGQLSGGQQQRAALARILVGQPEALLLDEPFSALDSFLREEVEGQLAALLAEFDRPALLVTHNRDEAYRLCPSLTVLDRGRVLRSGPTREVFADPRTLAAARLTGCKNILPCVRRSAHTVELTGWGRVLRVERAVPEGCRFVGIRAHDLRSPAPGAENLLPVRPGPVSENPFDWNLDCVGPAGDGHLWWKVSKNTLDQPCPPLPQVLEVPASAIMPLIATEEDLPL